jgi:hypothetical protein
MNMLWNLHRYSANKVLRRILKLIQRKLFDPGVIFSEYHRVITRPQTAIPFVARNRELIVNVCGRNVMHELILNYRSRNGYRNPTKVYKDFQKFVMCKTRYHSSDLAIACNLLKHVKLTDNQRCSIIQYVVDRLKVNNIFDRISRSRLSLKQLMVIELVKNTGKYCQ